MLVMSVQNRTDAMVVAALLHDVVEDCGVTIAEVAAAFGAEVAELVRWLTDVSRPEDGNRKARKAIDREKWRGCGNAAAKTIKLADLIDNSRSIVARDPKFAKLYLEEKRQLLPLLAGGDETLHRMAQEIVDAAEGPAQA